MPPENPAQYESPAPEQCLYDHTTTCHPKPCLTEAMRALGTHLGDLPAADHYKHQDREGAILVMRELMSCALAKMPILQERVAAAQQQAKNRR